ncbi:MAG: hypothetical protein K6U89_04780 [Chloroflexi bacterium]|nr:hypothetical protein [Chloroflexota bacterium]
MTIHGEPLVRFEWIGANLGVIGERLWEHLVLTLIAVSVGFAISFVFSLLIHRNSRLYLPITSVAGEAEMGTLLAWTAGMRAPEPEMTCVCCGWLAV